MFSFNFVSNHGNRHIVKVICNGNSSFNIDDLEIYDKGEWFAPTKEGLDYLHKKVSDEKIRRVLIQELRQNYRG